LLGGREDSSPDLGEPHQLDRSAIDRRDQTYFSRFFT
jgi:hypothetical protein